MAKEQLMIDINDKKLIRTHGFPFLMPMIKALYKEGKDTDQIKDHIRILISNHVEAKHEKIMEAIGYYAQKSDIKKAFLELIEKDFLNIGLPREEIALKAFKKSNPDILWNGDVPWEVEMEGIDITGNGFQVGFSVKGPYFKKTLEYEKHIEKLKSNKFKRCYIAFVDEKTKAVVIEKVK